MFVCGHSDVRLTTPPVLMLWGTQGYLWLPYNLTEVIKLIGERFEPKNTLCHSFRIIVIPSKLFRKLQILTSSKPSHPQRARKMATGGGHICEYL